MTRILMAFAGALLLSAPALAGEDALTAQESHDLARVWMQLHSDLVWLGGLSEAEATGMADDIDAYIEARGRREHLRAMLRDAKAAGCKDECVREAFRAMNRSMAAGLRDADAAKLVATALKEQQREAAQKPLTNKQMADQLRDRTQAQLAKRARDQQQGVGGSGSAGTEK